MKIISYCLWGGNPKYINGLYRNIETIKSKLPDYKIFLYTDKRIIIPSVDIRCSDRKQNKLMFERFTPASFSDVMYSRDLDSPISDREIAAMKEFEQSDKLFHIMRDHPWHKTRIPGGMWGAKRGAIPEMNYLVEEYVDRYKNEWFSDQLFLADHIYDRIKGSAMIHDSFSLYPEENALPFPIPREGDDFVGMSLPRVEEHHKILRDAENII
jgi:hypothetical protein